MAKDSRNDFVATLFPNTPAMRTRAVVSNIMTS